MADTQYPLWMYPDEPPVKEPIEPPPPATDPNAFPRGYRGLRIPGASSDEEFILREVLKRLAVLYPPTRISVAGLSMLEDNPAPGDVTPGLVEGRNYLDLLTGLLGILGHRGKVLLPQRRGDPHQPYTLDPVETYKDIKAGREASKLEPVPLAERDWETQPVPFIRERPNPTLERRARSMTERTPVPPLPDAKSLLPPEPYVIDLTNFDDLWQ